MLVLPVLALLYLGETLFPLRKSAPHSVRRLCFHGVLFFLNESIYRALFRGIVLACLFWTESRRWGPLHHLALPPAAQGLVCIVLFDLLAYFVHRAQHRIAILWRFHQVHHSDAQMDLSTSFRVHIGQTATSSLCEALFILALGPPLASYSLYALVRFLALALHHANLRLPRVLGRAMEWFVVTPSYHLVHHTLAVPEQARHYATLFTLWDTLMGTRIRPVRVTSAGLGIEGWGEEPLTVGAVLWSPFRYTNGETA